MYLYVFCGSENKQQLFLYTTNKWLVFITGAKCVYCAVRTGPLNKTDTVSSLKVKQWPAFSSSDWRTKRTQFVFRMWLSAVLVKLLICPSGQLRLVIMELIIMLAVKVVVSSVHRHVHTDNSTRGIWEGNNIKLFCVTEKGTGEKQDGSVLINVRGIKQRLGIIVDTAGGGAQIWQLTLILLTWTKWRAPTNASKWRMEFNSAFKGLKRYLIADNIHINTDQQY